MHDLERKSAAMNMAVDEALLRTATEPILRFYGWRQPSLSFGYFGRFSDVAAEARERELVRRWTGGGIVLHGLDLTYSIVLPRRRTSELPSTRKIYNDIHGAIREALFADKDVVLASENAPKISDTCFANVVTADVMVRGRKIAGAAQRRTRAGLLHQGSIQYEDLDVLFPRRFAAALCNDFQEAALDPKLWEEAQNLAKQKYGTVEWLRQR